MISQAISYVTGKAVSALAPDYLASGACQFEILKAEGLKPESTLLEFGCGCLLAGHFLIEYLNENNYTAVEPTIWVAEAGRAHFGITKKFTLLHNSEFSAPGTFDFIHSHSVLSHACKAQLTQYFLVVKNQLNPNGTALASLRLGADSNFSAWEYRSPSFFSTATVESCAQQAGLALTHRADIQRVMMAGTGNEHHHDWIQLKHL